MQKYFIIVLLLLPVFSLMAGVRNTDGGIEFSYDAPNAASVSVAGSFNGWNTTSNPLQKGSDGIWKATIRLASGKHQYKFVVDGNWNYDQENSETADDGYGGQNSAVEVGADGKLIQKARVELTGIKTSLNPKITFNGRYFTKNNFINNERVRYTLVKPLHDIDLIPVIKFSNDFKAVTVWKINNQVEGADMYKTHLKFLRSEMFLNTDYMNFYAFDNAGTIRFDDPLHFVGNDGKYGFDFGWGFRGVMAQTPAVQYNGIQPQVIALFADGTRVTTFSEGDVVAGRGTVRLGPDGGLKLGTSAMDTRIPLVNTTYQKHRSNAFDLTYTMNSYQFNASKPLTLESHAEYYYFRNSNVDSMDVKWLEGDKLQTGFTVRFPQALSMFATFRTNKVEFPSVVRREQLEAGARFEMLKSWFAMQAKWMDTTMPTDNSVSWSDYYRYLEKTDGNGRWFQQFSDVPWENYTVIGYPHAMTWKTDLGCRFHFLKWDYSTQLITKGAQTAFAKQPKYIENVLKFSWFLNQSWSIDTDTRVPFYNDDFLGIKTNIGRKVDFWWANYSRICYKMAENVQVTLGWGVNPITLNDVTDDFTATNRDAFMQADTVMGNAADTQIENAYFGLGDFIRAQEKALKNEQRISVTATMKF